MFPRQFLRPPMPEDREVSRLGVLPESSKMSFLDFLRFGPVPAFGGY
jgi:hypothetical protein